MKYSLEWLSGHIDGVLPPVESLVREITEKAFEVEGVESSARDIVIEAKILPDRAHDALSHRGMAREIAALFNLKRKDVGFGWPKADATVTPIGVAIDEPALCMRYIGVRVDGVSLKESPRWLRDRLESVGQRSINALVDVTNFVMFDIGQPMHAFDARKVSGGIHVRLAKKGETMTTLDNKIVSFDGTELVIADDESVLAMAGVKGGKKAEVDSDTVSIILESANFHPTRTRLTSVKHNIRTDASKRYENGITSDLAEEGAKEALALLLEIYPDAAVANPTDTYPSPEKPYKTGVSVREATALLGVELTEKDIIEIFQRAHIPFDVLSPRKRLLEIADSVIGKEYRRGAGVLLDAPERFDCSSLVAWIYKEVGFSIPRISVDQKVFALPIEEKDLLPGDLVFTNTGIEKSENGIHFESREWMKGTKVPGGIDHVGIWTGEGYILHASSSHRKVVKEKLDDSEQFRNPRSYGRIIEKDEDRFVVTVPPERRDLRRAHDLIEEIGRQYGYNKIPAVLPNTFRKGTAHKRIHYANKIRAYLASMGYSEVYTYSFAKKGEGQIEVMNPVGQDRPFIRTDLAVGMTQALVWNIYNSPLIGVEDIRIFEFGNVFRMNDGGTEEHMSLAIASAPGNKKSKKELEEEMRVVIARVGELLNGSAFGDQEAAFTVIPIDSATLRHGGYLKEIDLDSAIERSDGSTQYVSEFVSPKDVLYRPVSQYPFVVRDISLFVPADVLESDVELVLKKEAGDLLVKFSCFDRFQKSGEDRISYAFRFVFQSFERTLTDDEVNAAMGRVYSEAAKRNGWEVR
jgi:phenylalanyl-tRNA synthetase beta subunit